MRRRIDTSKLFQRTLIATAVAAALAGPTITCAQSADATLRGRAAPDTEITAKNIATGASRRTKSGADGAYTLAGLPPGTYRVDAGPGTEQTITLSVSSTQTYDFVQSAAHDAELSEIVVSGTRLNEVRTSEVGGIVSLHDIEVTPQITRNFLEFADQIPGMVFTVDGKGNTSIRGGAQIDSNVNVYIDGVGMKDYVSNGGLSGQSGASKSGDPGNPFPQLAIAEYKVITSNYGAQYDQVASAALSAQTKSGTNEFSGEAFGNFTNQNLRASTPAEIYDNVPGDTKVAGSTYEYGFAQGGPIIPDVAHFFGTWEHKDLSLPNSVYPPGQDGATLAALQSTLPANVFSQYGPVTNPFKEDLIFAKIDFEPSDHDRFELTDLTRLETQTVGASAQTATSAAFDYKNNNERLALRWQHAADNWVNEARVTYEKATSSPQQSGENPAITYQWWETPELSTTAIQVNGQDPRSYYHYEQKGPSLQDDFTLNNLNWLGQHTLTMGAKFKSAELTARDASEGANYYYAVDSTGTYPTPYQAVFTVNNPGQNPTAESTDHQFGVYFQDDWVPIERLTLNLGLRWDYETVPSWQNYVLPQNIVNGLYGQYPGGPAGETYAQALALGGVNIADYIGNGSNRKSPTNEYQPRVGLSFDINNDQKHVVFGGYARSYDRNVFDIMSLERTKLALSEPQINFYGTPYTNSNCTTAAQASTSCVAWNPAYLNLANLQALGTGNFGEIDLTNNNLKNPYSDQFSIGFRNRVGDWNTSVAISQINSYNVIIGHLGNRYANGAYYQNGTQWGAAGVPGFQNLVLWDNSGEDKNFQVGVVLEKPYTKETGWSVRFAYTYSDAQQNNPYTYQSNNEYAFDLPFPKDYPFLPSSAVSRHRLVTTGSVDGPFGVQFGVKVVLATPMPLATVEGCQNASDCHGYNAYPVVGNFRDTFGESEVDVQATKNFVVWQQVNGYFRVDVLNLFNSNQYDPSAGIFNPVGGQKYPPPQYNTAGPILGVPLTLKLTFGLKW